MENINVVIVALNARWRIGLPTSDASCNASSAAITLALTPSLSTMVEPAANPMASSYEKSTVFSGVNGHRAP